MLDYLSVGSSFYVMPFFNQMPPPGSMVGNKPKPVDPPLFFQADDRFYQFSNTTQVVAGKNVPKVTNGRGLPAATFRWLPYIAGLITYVPLNGGPILTGKFTGCWMAIFTIKGVACVAHIGTDSNSRANTEDVKNAWKIAKGRGIIREVAAFNPISHATGASTFGAIAADQSMHALACDESAPGCFKVKTIKSVAGSPSPQFV